MELVASGATARESAFAPLFQSRTLRLTGVLLLLWLGLALHPETRDAFLSTANFSNLTAQVSEIVIIGVGMTMVILIGGIDLSVGAYMALAGVIAAKLQIDYHQSAWVAGGAAVAGAVLLGLWHGLLVTRFRVPPFIATLSGFLAYRGLGLVISDARGLSPLSPDMLLLGGRLPGRATLALAAGGALVGLGVIFRRVARRRALGLPVAPAALTLLKAGAVVGLAAFLVAVYRNGAPVPVALAALTAALGALILHRTRAGRWAFAIGGNAEAARLSGVPVTGVTVFVYTLTAVLTAIGGLVAMARTNGVTPGNAGIMRELHVITAVVIGGTALTGGRATIVGTVIGALIFGTMSNGMNLLNVNSNWQLIFTGGILLGASLLDSVSSERKSS